MFGMAAICVTCLICMCIKEWVMVQYRVTREASLTHLCAMTVPWLIHLPSCVSTYVWRLSLTCVAYLCGITVPWLIQMRYSCRWYCSLALARTLRERAVCGVTDSCRVYLIQVGGSVWCDVFMSVDVCGVTCSCRWQCVVWRIHVGGCMWCEVFMSTDMCGVHVFMSWVHAMSWMSWIVVPDMNSCIVCMSVVIVV